MGFQVHGVRSRFRDDANMLANVTYFIVTGNECNEQNLPTSISIQAS